ncbi:MAG: OmpA family protein [Bacteroidota bacterium]
MLKIGHFISGFVISFMFFAANAQDNESACPELANKKAVKTYQKALDLFKDRKTAEAYPLFKEVTELDPTAANAYFFMGYINFKKQDYNLKAAEANLLKAVELCPDVDIYAYYFLGDIYAGDEKWDLAVKYLSKFVKDAEKVDNDADYNRAGDLLKWAKFYNDAYSKPVPFNPIYVKGICTANDEILPFISPDGEVALYTRRLEMPPNRNDLVPKPVWKEKFYESLRKDGSFDNGKEMPWPFNVFDNEGGATLTLLNDELYYTVGKYNMANYLNCDIYYSHKDANGIWSEPEAVPTINDAKTWEAMPSISSDGKTLYFVSDRPGGLGGYDIWRSRKNEAGEWKTPENLGPSINTKGNEKSPFIHSDSQTLYFSSDSDDLMGMGGYDIYFSRMQPDGSWSKPVNIGYPINTKDDETSFFASANARTGYFASNKLKGPGGWDIYSFELYKEARAEEVAIIKGEVKDEGTNMPVNARIEIKNVETKKVTEIPVDTVTGKYAVAVIMKSDYIMTIKKPDYAYESKYISQGDPVFDEPVIIDFEIKPVEVGNSYRLNDVYFETNSFELSVETKLILDGFIEFLEENPAIKVSIQGHTDNVGNDEGNLKLSESRAKSVYEYLIQRSIDASRLSFQGFGETKPLVSNDTPEGRAKNRRTEFVIMGK